MNPIARFFDFLPPILVWPLFSAIPALLFSLFSFAGGNDDPGVSTSQKIKDNFVGFLGATLFVMVLSLPILLGGGFR
jgi:hypothetical protein